MSYRGLGAVGRPFGQVAEPAPEKFSLASLLAVVVVVSAAVWIGKKG
jgi:hypothetical protein